MKNSEIPYNYTRFRPEFYNLESFGGPRFSEKFPNLSLENHLGKKLSLNIIRGNGL